LRQAGQGGGNDNIPPCLVMRFLATPKRHVMQQRAGVQKLSRAGGQCMDGLRFIEQARRCLCDAQCVRHVYAMTRAQLLDGLHGAAIMHHASMQMLRVIATFPQRWHKLSWPIINPVPPQFNCGENHDV